MKFFNINYALVNLLLFTGLTLAGQSPSASPGRLVTEEERNTVTVFREINTAVVHIVSKEKVDLKFEEITPKSGVGSGIVISPEGHILTNYHVIEDSNQIEVAFNDGQRTQAVIVGTAPQLDLALLKVESKTIPLTVARLGNSDELMVGQKVLAIGHPLDLHMTLSAGIVSSLNRTLEDLSLELKGRIIQTDAAINPGSSGGPLVNSRGEVVGINTAIALGGQNVGFAIPINMAKKVLPDLIQFGHPMRPFLGFNALELDRYISQLFGLPLAEGLLVQEVIEGSPVEQAGLEGGQRLVLFNNQKFFLGGDIITEFNGVKTPSLESLAKQLSKAKPGDRVEMTVFRDGTPLKIAFVLAPMIH